MVGDAKVFGHIFVQEYGRSYSGPAQAKRF